MSEIPGQIRYLETLVGIEQDSLRGFFVGWRSPLTPERHLEVLRGSREVVLAWDDELRRVVGFINALSDGHVCAFIPLLEVLPEFRGCGIGSELVRRLLSRLESYYAVDVICDAEVIPFYKRFGLFEGKSMMRRNYT
jgi:ribosomal protein S18 acetylase RimI-like enzyme